MGYEGRRGRLQCHESHHGRLKDRRGPLKSSVYILTNYVEVGETKIDAAATKNAPGVPRGVKEGPWGPF